MVTVRPAASADVLAYYGEPSRHTMQAVMLEKGGELVGIIGVATLPGRRVLFSEYKPELGDDIRSFAVRRAAIEMTRLAISSKLPVFSVKEEESDVLERLGFERVSGDLYQWPSSQPSPRTSKQPPPP